MRAAVVNQVEVTKSHSTKEMSLRTEDERKTAYKCPYFKARQKGAKRICGNCENLFSRYCKSYMEGVLALEF
jgi:hypothetical protein